jgi:hypothetical protein
MIKSFGQKVNLEVFSKTGDLVFSSQKVKDSTNPYESLRVDFHVIKMTRFNRAKFDIYNLSDKTVKELCSGERYCRLSVSLHDQPYEILVDNMFVSNALRETVIPSNITSLYCFDRAKKDVTETNINMVSQDTSLEGICSGAIDSLDGVDEVIYKNFPSSHLKYKSANPKYLWSGSVEGLLDTVSESYGASWFIEDKSIILMYKPDLSKVKESGLEDKPADIVLQTSNLRSTPKVGPANLQIVSNLDVRIKPTSILDSSELVTATTSSNLDTLQLTKNFLKSPISGFSKFQCVAVEHRGSNFTNKWETSTTAVSPKKGNKMPIYNWHGTGG